MKSGYFFYSGLIINESKVTLSSFNGLIEAPDAFTAFGRIVEDVRTKFSDIKGIHQSDFYVQIDVFKRVEDAE